MTARILALLLLFAALAPAARAGEFVVEPGTTFAYADRPDLCRIDGARSETEAALLAMFAAADGQNLQALLTLYDCPFFQSLSTAEVADPALWVRIVTARDGGRLVVLPLDRETFLDQIGAELEAVLGGSFDGSMEAELQAAIDRVNREAPTAGGEDFQLSKVEPLGILARDRDALYAGIVGVAALGGAQATVLTVLGVTQLQGRPITVYLSRPYGGPESVAAQLDETRAIVADLVRLNDPEGAAGGSGGFDWTSVLLWAAIGGGIGLVVALVLRARRKRSA